MCRSLPECPLYHPQVSLPGTNRACLRAVLEFLYTELFVPSPDLDAMELLVLTNRLCLTRLQALTGESLWGSPLGSVLGTQGGTGREAGDPRGCEKYCSALSGISSSPSQNSTRWMSWCVPAFSRWKSMPR